MACGGRSDSGEGGPCWRWARVSLAWVGEGEDSPRRPCRPRPLLDLARAFLARSGLGKGCPHWIWGGRPLPKPGFPPPVMAEGREKKKKGKKKKRKEKGKKN